MSKSKPKLRYVAALTAGLSVLALSTAFAQTPRSVSIGQSVRGDLTTRDLKAEDDSYYDEYAINLSAGQGIIVTMQSGAFDTFLAIGQGRGADFNQLSADDDSGGGDNGTDSRLRFRAQEAGSYVIRANSVGGEQTGAYTVGLEARPPAAAPKTAALRVGSAETSVNGVLADGGARLEDEGEQLYDAYTVTLRKGDVLKVAMTAEYDNRVRLVRNNGAETEVVTEDDDSGGNSNALLIYKVEEAGSYTIQATGFDENSAGAYKLSAQLLPPPPATAPRPVGISKGQTINGALAIGDGVIDPYTLFDTYELRGRKGETVTIRLSTSEGGFDPILAVGGYVAGKWAQIEENDDDPEAGEGGVPLASKITFTFEENGSILLRARSINSGQMGPYTISVE